MQGLTQDADRDGHGHENSGLSGIEEQLVKRYPFDELHHQRELAFLLHDVDGLHDVRMAEPRHQADLVLEADRELGVVHEVLVQAFDCDEPLEAERAELEPQMDDPHATRCQALTEQVRPDHRELGRCDRGLVSVCATVDS